MLRWIPQSGRQLDIGCGAGLFLGLVGRARPLVRAIGFDADAAAIADAQGMAQRHFTGGRIAFQHSAVGDAWPGGPFDIVSMIDVLHHIPPLAQRGVIEAACVHLAPGGVFVYKDMADQPWFRAGWNRLHDLIIARQWINYRGIGEVEAWLRGCGLDIIDRSARAIGPYGHETIVAKRPG